ncbi:hypothetical protein F4808DRAFT_413387 [Astrocystis sublimbata]|nr:hypothetical protein F4808DRAFT_413387 [Astrocystis sublimbata]
MAGRNSNTFWDVFADDMPRVPTVDEFICRIVGLQFPRGIVRDINGILHNPPNDPGTTVAAIMEVITTASGLEAGFYTRTLRRNLLYVPAAWGLKLSINIALTEAENMINEALGEARNLQQLDTLFWDAYKRAEVLCGEKGVQLEWPPFKQL